MKEVFLGSTSRLGIALYTQNKISHSRIVMIDSRESIKKILAILARIEQPVRLHYFPFSKKEKDINYNKLNSLISKSKKINQLITYGSVHEVSDIKGLYLDEKRKIVKLKSAQKNITHIHFRMHTLYGSPQPIPKMFLSDLIESIRLKVDFEMSQGNQLREYQSYDQVSRIIWYILLKRKTRLKKNKIVISSGNPCALKDVATLIFSGLKWEKKIIYKHNQKDSINLKFFQNDSYIRRVARMDWNSLIAHVAAAVNFEKPGCDC